MPNEQATLERLNFKPVAAARVKPRWQLDPDLVLYLPLWNLSGDTFLSQDAYGHTVTRYGATPTGQGGWDFDGTDDYAQIPNGGWVTTTRSAITVVGWAKTDTSIDAARMLINREQLDSGFALGAGWVANKFTMYINTTPGSAWTNADGATSIALTTWYHVAGVYDGSNVVLYVNGVQDGIAAKTGNLSGGTQNVTIGVKSDSLGNAWDGFIGEGRIYNRALAAHEILNLFHETKGLYGGG